MFKNLIPEGTPSVQEAKLGINERFTLSEGITLLGKDPEKSERRRKDGGPLAKVSVPELPRTFSRAFLALYSEDRKLGVRCVSENNSVWIMTPGKGGAPDSVEQLEYFNKPKQLPDYAIVVVENSLGDSQIFIQAVDPTMETLRILSSEQAPDVSVDFTRAKLHHPSVASI
jgi:hypothetical protein